MVDEVIDWFIQAFETLGPIDAVCIAVVAFFAVRGLFKGFLRQAGLIVSILLGFFLSKVFAGDLAQYLPRVTSRIPEEYHIYVAYFAIFVVTFVTMALIVKALRRALEALELGGLDRLLGMATGSLIGALLCALALTLALMFTPHIGPGEDIHGIIKRSRSLKLVTYALPRLTALLPAEMVERGESIVQAYEMSTPDQNQGEAGVGHEEHGAPPPQQPDQHGQPEIDWTAAGSSSSTETPERDRKF